MARQALNKKVDSARGVGNCCRWDVEKLGYRKEHNLHLYATINYC